MGKIIDRVRKREAAAYQERLLEHKASLHSLWALGASRVRTDLAGPPMVRCFIGAAGEDPREITGATMSELLANVQAQAGNQHG